MHRRRNDDAAGEVAILIKRAEKACDVRQARVEKLLYVAVDTAHDLRQVHARCADDGADRRAADQKRHALASVVEELT